MLLFLVQYHLPLSHRFNLDTRKIPNNKPLDHPIGCASIPPFYNCLSNHTTPLNRVPTNRGWHQRDILKNLLRNTNFLPRCLPSSPLLLLPFPSPSLFHPRATHPRKKDSARLQVSLILERLRLRPRRNGSSYIRPRRRCCWGAAYRSLVHHRHPRSLLLFASSSFHPVVDVDVVVIVVVVDDVGNTPNCTKNGVE